MPLRAPICATCRTRTTTATSLLRTASPPEVDAGANTLAAVSGYFSPAVWAVLGDALDRLDSFRLLLGKDHELDRLEPDQEGRNVERLVEAAIRQDSEPAGLITRSQAAQLAALVAFLERQKLVAADGEVVRLWRGDEFFHAKAYIAREDNKWVPYGIGSANFTFNGLSRNRELMGWQQSLADGKSCRRGSSVTGSMRTPPRTPTS